MSSTMAPPLKVTSASALTRASPQPSITSSITSQKHAIVTNPSDAEISSPHELTAFVETLLEQLDSQFDDMSSRILDQMAQMSNRVDALEAAIHDIISGGITTPVASSPLASTG